MTEKKPGEPDERIVAAAILREGVVFTGAHHHQIIRYMARTLDLKVVKGEQGFITSGNRFVDRVEAARIAFAAKQIAIEYEGLFSEQLWNLSDYPPSEITDESFARARREGAREALERAAKVAFDVVFNLDNEPEGLADAVAHAIRALADQAEARNKALVEALTLARDAINTLDADVFGTGSQGELEWSIRDEVIDKITVALAAHEERSKA